MTLLKIVSILEGYSSEEGSGLESNFAIAMITTLCRRTYTVLDLINSLVMPPIPKWAI
jgi:hypothetical protein